MTKKMTMFKGESRELSLKEGEYDLKVQKTSVHCNKNSIGSEKQQLDYLREIGDSQ